MIIATKTANKHVAGKRWRMAVLPAIIGALFGVATGFLRGSYDYGVLNERVMANTSAIEKLWEADKELKGADLSVVDKINDQSLLAVELKTRLANIESTVLDIKRILERRELTQSR